MDSEERGVRFGGYFEIECILHETEPRHGLIAGMSGTRNHRAALSFLMTRNTEKTI
jgi:hypothetical protein